jgi:phosphatidylglycerophosphate synthase
MIVAKQIADLITLTRALLFLCYTWLGITRGSDCLPLAATLLIYSWTSDSLDGPIARRSSRYYHSWLGDHDLEVDISVSAGVLIYVLLAGYLPLLVGAGYLTIWLFVFLIFGYYRSLGMLFQAPLYGYLLWISLQFAPNYGLSMIIWILAALVLTWPRFPKEVVPGFLQGFKIIRRTKR